MDFTGSGRVSIFCAAAALFAPGVRKVLGDPVFRRGALTVRFPIVLNPLLRR